MKMIKSDRFDGECWRYIDGPTERLPGSDVGVVQALIDLSFHLLHSENVSERLAYSEVHARRLALRAVGESVGSFARRLRLESAAGKLSLCDGTVSEIAREAGYHTPESFCRAFHNHFDCSPSAYRKLNRGPGHLHPGYALSVRVRDGLPSSVTVSIDDKRSVKFLYDGPVFLARVLPSGRFDWLPR